MVGLVRHRQTKGAGTARRDLPSGGQCSTLPPHKQNAVGWMWAMIGILVLFNPLVPIHLRRDTWRLADSPEV